MFFAEIGINHVGNVNYANYYLDRIINSQVDGVTFQIKNSNFYRNYEESYKKKDKKFYSNFREKKIYKILFKKKKIQNLTLKNSFYKNAKYKCKKNGKLFGVALGDVDLISFFCSINIDFVKILSEDFENENLIKKLLNSKIKKIYISTGGIPLKKIKTIIEKIPKNKLHKICLIYTEFERIIKKNNLKKINLLKKICKRVAYGQHSNNKKILFEVKKYKPESIFFYIKGNRLKFHPDDNHALSISEINYYINKLKIIL